MTPYYEEAGVVIYHGDCREIAPSLTFDAILTDPPYGVGIDYGPASEDKDLAGTVRWLLSFERPVVFTVIHRQLWEIPKPQWLDVWHKPLVLGAWSSVLLPHWEAVVFYGVPGRHVRGDVFRYNQARNNGHRTPKPVGLFTDLLRLLPGVPLDPYAGSGTTLVAAKNLGRRAIGIEIEERYCEVAVKRLRQEVLAL